MTSQSSQSYHLTVGAQSFYAVVERKSSDRFHVVVGGKKRGCIVITIIKTKGSLHVSYDQQWTMVAGAGTIAMLKAAIQFTFSHFPKLKYIIINDHSHVKCGDLDMYLPPLELAKYGKTWYERHIDAVLLKEDEDKYRSSIDRYVSLCNQNQELKAFQTVIQPILERQILHERIPANVKKLVKSSFKAHNGNLRNMVRDISKDHGCDVLVAWLEAYFYEITQMGMFKELDFAVYRNAFPPLTMTTVKLDTNPYAKEIMERQRYVNNRMDMFTSFVPRSHMSHDGGCAKGTYFTHGVNARYEDI